MIKYFIFIAIFLSQCLPASANQQLFMAQIARKNAVTPSYLINQTFPAAGGYSNGETWVETINGGTLSRDVGDGQYIFDDTYNWSWVTSPTVAPMRSISFEFMFDNLPSDEAFFINPGPTALILMSLRTNGAIYAKHGTVQMYGATGPAAGTWYKIWYDYIKSSGANDGVAQIFVTPVTGSLTTKPATPYMSTTVGNSTSDLVNFNIRSERGSGMHFRNVRGSSLVIGDN